MASYTFTEIIDALAGIVDAVADTGVVLTDKRTVEDAAEILTLVQALHPTGLPQAWLITLAQISEVDTPNGCEITQTLTISLECLYPYQRLRSDNSSSETAVRIMLEAVFAALRTSRNLGLDNRVWHMLLQTVDDFSIASWEGTGQDSLLTHFIRCRLLVNNTVFV